MTSSERAVFRGVAAVLEEHLSISNVDETTHLFRDLSLDSVQQLTLVVELENKFEICFDEGDETSLQTVGDVVSLVERRMSSR